MKRQAERAPYKTCKHKNGVKGLGTFSELPTLDISTALGPEYMHTVLLGVVKQFLKFWISIPGLWTLSRVLHLIDEEMLNLKPPNTFSRLPRKLSEYSLYKASEFYNFLLFYSVPILKKHLTPERFQHWLCLVISMEILLKEEINETELQLCEKLLQFFVKNAEILYVDRCWTYNVHNLLHLPLYVRRMGPLWASSAFFFEHLNGVINHMNHGTNHVLEELINNITLVRDFECLKHQYGDILPSSANDNVTSEVLGKSLETKSLEPLEIEFLSTKNVFPENIDIFSRAGVKGNVFTSKKHKALKTESFYVEIKTKEGASLLGVIRFYFRVKGASDFSFCIELLKETEHFISFEGVDGVPAVRLSNNVPVVESGNLEIINAKEIETIRHLVKVENFVCFPPNNLKEVI